MQKLESFFTVARRYRAVFYDAYGVLRRLDGMIEGVADTVTRLRQQGVRDYVLTNDASRPVQQLAQSYPYQGALLFQQEQIISSGLLAADHLARMGIYQDVAYLGLESSRWYLEQAGIQAQPLLHMKSVPQALVWMDNDGFDWMPALIRATNILLSHDIPTIIANPDLVYPAGAGLIHLAPGSLAVAIERATGRNFVRFGKPGGEIFGWAMRLASQILTDLRPDQVLMVGDTLETDIAGAAAAGVDSVLVLTGNTSADRLERLLAASPVQPTYLCSSVVS